jgi:hypothetical protein
VCNELEIPGCTNAAACNYNASATDDNGSCAVPTGCEFCNGTAVADGDADNDGVCDADEVVGCQDATACNYLATATDAGECDFCSCQGNTTNIAGYDVVIEPVAVHTTGALAGKTTYRLYLETPNTNDVVTAFIGDDEFALNVATTTSFYQNALGGLTAESVTPALVGVDPLLAYDSYVTIGLTGPANTAAGEYGIMPIPPGATSAWATNFAAGGNIAINDAIGSGWYTLPSAANAVSGADHRVLFAQLTTDGKISGSFRAQVFPAGVAVNDDQVDITFLNGVCGCTDATAFNYDPNADFLAAGSCVYVYPGCTDASACNYNALANVDNGSCTYAAAGYDCAGACLADADGDGVCNEFEVDGCTDATACNYDADDTGREASSD